MTQEISITINCQRTHSNLLQITVWGDSLELAFLNGTVPDEKPQQVGESEAIMFADFPEAQDIVHCAYTHNIWDADMLWSIATLHEDHQVTALGHYALNTESCWESDAPDFTNLPAESNVA